MSIFAWVLLAVTSLSMLARKDGTVYGVLFFISLIVGFFTFGFWGGTVYLVLLVIGGVAFHVVERFLSAGVAIKLAKRDIKNED